MSPFVQAVTHILSIFTLLADILIVFLVLAIFAKKFGADSVSSNAFLDFFGRNAVLFSFLIALAGMAFSLFYSEIAGFLPCFLCWWQRIFLYPQVFIFGIALWKKRTDVFTYTIPLSIIGGLIAIYGSYLQFGGSPFIPCSASGASCSQVYFLEYGYITIPTMALTTFAMFIILFIAQKVSKK